MRTLHVKELLIWFGVALTVVLLFGGRETLLLYELARRGTSVIAVVTAKEAQMHATIKYSYTVKSETFHGADRVGLGTPRFSDLKPGDRILAYFVPAKPWISCLGDAREKFFSYVRVVGVAAVISATAIVWALRRCKITFGRE
jgi:hypothetical protein